LVNQTAFVEPTPLMDLVLQLLFTGIGIGAVYALAAPPMW
jgi:hypothetical protein